MEKEIVEKIEQQIKEKKQTYITLEELKKVIGTEIPYMEMFNIIKQFINDGVLKAIRKKQEW